MDDDCKMIKKIKICNPSVKLVKFRFLSGSPSQTRVHNTLEYLQKMQVRAVEGAQESVPEGKSIYDVIVDIAQETDLTKRKGRQKVVDAIKRGTDLCQTVGCSTTAEMSLMIHDLMNIFDDPKIKEPGEPRGLIDRVLRRKRKANDLVLDRKMNKFIDRVVEKRTVL